MHRPRPYTLYWQQNGPTNYANLIVRIVWNSRQIYLWPLKWPLCVLLWRVRSLSPLATDATSQLDVFWHDGDTLGVDGAQVGVLEKSDQVGLAGFLQGHDGRALESQIGLEILSNLTDQALEGQLADQQLRALLVTTDLTEGDSSWPVSMGLLHSTGSRGALPCCLGGQLLSWGLASSWFSCGLLRSCHSEWFFDVGFRRRANWRMNDARPTPAPAICRLRQLPELQATRRWLVNYLICIFVHLSRWPSSRPIARHPFFVAVIQNCHSILAF